MFELNRVVIHEVKKKVHEILTTLDLSATIATQDLEIFSSLVESINTVYSVSSSLKNTHFAPDADTVFSTHLKRYLQEGTDESFYTFSVQSMQALKALMEEVLLATGGFYCFADYTDHGRHCLAVILLRHKNGFNFVKVANTFTASGTESLNFDKIATGFRLNVAIYEDDADARNSIALIASQQDQLSSYFKRWVSVAEIITNTINTRELVKLVKELPMPVD
jgi:nucleoid-associated protein